MIKEMSDLKRSVIANTEKLFSILERNINITMPGYADAENEKMEKKKKKSGKKKWGDPSVSKARMGILKTYTWFKNVKTIILRAQII